MHNCMCHYDDTYYYVCQYANKKRMKKSYGDLVAMVELVEKTARIVLADANILLVAGGADRLFDTR